MSLTRRYFLKSAAAASAAVATTQSLEAYQQPRSSSPNEKIGVAVIGAGGRGSSHLGAFSGGADSEVLYICDVDTNAGRKIKGVEEKQGRAPQFLQDFRKVLDDPNVDAISTATPNHWHALVSILAMQAGKHVYVEKPVSHNVWEGRQAVKWSRELNKICQCGTQSRSSPSLKSAVEYVRSGKLGPIQYAIGTCYKPRKSIGKLDQPLQIPDSIDYDMWCGPAEMVDLYRPRLHYDWHWDFNTGNGDMGNQGIHQMDIARWFLGEDKLSPRVMSIGGRVGYDDAGDTPNTQIVYHDFEAAPLIFETRGLPKKDLDWKNGMDEYRGSRIGVIVQCENGYVVIPSYTKAEAFDNDGNSLQAWSGGGDHFQNFLDAVRSGDRNDLNADILEGHLSSALCHTGAISHQLGSTKTSEEIGKEVAGDPLWSDSWERMEKHLAANGVELSDPKLSVGPWLTMDPDSETFPGNESANALLTRPYREGYVVPDADA
ncbi:Glucose--fructose oxidoreductase precursor [Thalassoglobus neptunius]|uniref:Glucose--fructose oxidoreductase n=1 Tax=Thalassoglobus neptunius TaxID=1938619 RepID=A0A5C5WQ33_9PLAN|nr:Gfo/Idh/MocA family oxidoreductase [Thalassoglobus neptunius]TWT52231.1 Glucose--fructose oxidoreductase precursor [Thalassoglobus neptunius]